MLMMALLNHLEECKEEKRTAESVNCRQTEEMQKDDGASGGRVIG